MRILSNIRKFVCVLKANWQVKELCSKLGLGKAPIPFVNPRWSFISEGPEYITEVTDMVPFFFDHVRMF